jgi:hypothetical protein
MRYVSRAMLSAAAMCFIAGAAEAAVHKYTITGEASGIFAGTTFNAATFTISIMADDANFFNVSATTSRCSPVFAIARFYDATVLDGADLGYNSDNNAVFISHDAKADIFDFFVPFSFVLNVTFTNVPGTGGFALGQFNNVATTGGDLSFDTSSDVLFSTNFVGASVPLPGAGLLLLGGMAAFAVVGRRRAA